jgi:hypothetical protein
VVFCRFLVYFFFVLLSGRISLLFLFPRRSMLPPSPLLYPVPPLPLIRFTPPPHSFSILAASLSVSLSCRRARRSLNLLSLTSLALTNSPGEIEKESLQKRRRRKKETEKIVYVASASWAPIVPLIHCVPQQ